MPFAAPAGDLSLQKTAVKIALQAGAQSASGVFVVKQVQQSAIRIIMNSRVNELLLTTAQVFPCLKRALQ